MNKKVILFAPGPFGGIEQIIIQTANLLDVNLWIIKELRNKIPAESFVKLCQGENIKFTIFESKSIFDLKLLMSLRKKIKSERISLVHSHGLKANFYCAFLPLQKIATQHGRTSQNKKVIFYEFLENIALKKMNFVICVSKHMYNHSRYKKKILIENFLSKKYYKKRFRMAGDLNILFIGRLSIEKGFYDLLHFFEQSENITLTVIGDGKGKVQLTKLIQKKGLIKYLGFKNDFAEDLENADVLIMPSHTEGLPMTLIEATAAGIPVIASNVGGIPLFFEQNSLSDKLIFKPKDIDDMKRAIEEYLKNRSKYNEIARKAATMIKERYSKEKWVHKINLLYKSLL